jgi:hypothetical protein
MVKISPQKQHIIKSASASTKSLSSPINSDASAAISQLTAPISPNTNQQSPKVIYISDADNKQMSPWFRLSGSLLATAGLVGGIVLGLERHHNRQIRKVVLPHIEKYLSADNELHITNSVKPRGEIYKLLTRPDIPKEHKNDINTFLDALNIDPKNGNIIETHLLSENGDHYIDGLTLEGIERASVILSERLPKIYLTENKALALSLSERISELGLESKELPENHTTERPLVCELIHRELQNLAMNHADKSMPAYGLKNPYLALNVLVNVSPEDKTNVLNPVDNKPFSKETNFSNHRFSSLIPQSSSSYYSAPFSSLTTSLMWLEIFNLSNANRY